jgi:hypothetical protein
MQIRFERWPITAVAYHVLAHLDLGRDAASLHDDTLPARPWAAALREAYAAARGRLAVHGAPLWYGDRLVARLREGVPTMLRDAEGRALALAFADAIETEAPAYLAAFERDARPLDDIATAIAEPLARLRAALWERAGAAPPLVIVDCMQPMEWLACQVLHEEIHAITDDAVLAGRDARTRDTRAGTPGYAMHDELERAAIEVGDALVRARAPEWSDAYARWRATFDRRG